MPAPTDHEFTSAADRFMESLLERLEQLDPDDVDCDLAMGVLTMSFADGRKFVLNRQTAAHQIWFAHGVHAYHFAQDAANGRWLDTKGRGELREIVAKAVGDKIGTAVTL